MSNLVLILFGALLSLNVLAKCEDNVDKLQIFYINGMFTTAAGFTQNQTALDNFQSQYLSAYASSGPVTGSYNFNEKLFEQVIEVNRQKWEDISKNSAEELAIRKALNGDHEDLSEAERARVIDFYADISQLFYDSIMSETDYRNAFNRLDSTLRACPRVVLVTHSQGNFYGNILYDDMMSSFIYDQGYKISDFPMLGTMQIASPVNIPGGEAAATYPDLIGHLTNDTDLPMLGVRKTLGSIDPNYESPINWDDLSGHGLEASYLTQSGQATVIANQIGGIVASMRPYPIHKQQLSSSSALSGFGYSSISSILDINFQDGSVYRYFGVTDGTFAGLNSASSQGSYFNEFIRNNYSNSKLLP